MFLKKPFPESSILPFREHIYYGRFRVGVNYVCTQFLTSRSSYSHIGSNETIKEFPTFSAINSEDDAKNRIQLSTTVLKWDHF